MVMHLDVDSGGWDDIAERWNELVALVRELGEESLKGCEAIERELARRGISSTPQRDIAERVG